MAFADVLAEVETECRRLQIPLLGRHKATRLVELIRAEQPNLVVEVGTAIGYSGLWIADCLRQLGRGRLVTLEQDPERALQAGKAFERAGLSNIISQLVGDARERIGEVKGPIDVLFLDGGFENYHPCYLRCRPHLRDGALLVADNAGIGAKEMDDYLTLVRAMGTSHTEWFDTDIPWNPRDAIEISRHRPEKP
jgi:caffeoyl-CoA O-methyltransferase